MNEVEAVTIQCPYCWESFNVTVDCSVESQDYIEDCEVCCKPIEMSVTTNGGIKPQVVTHHESE